MIDHFHVRIESGFWRFFRIGLEVIDTADAIEKLEFELAIISEKPADFKQVVRIDYYKRINRAGFLGLDFLAEFLLEN
jgi:hypothetical protein